MCITFITKHTFLSHLSHLKFLGRVFEIFWQSLHHGSLYHSYFNIMELIYETHISQIQLVEFKQ